MTLAPHALLSVSDKRGLAPLAEALVRAGVTLLSTGGTFRLLREAGLPVTEVAAYTGFDEMMDGRVKSLHPKVHGGILGRRGEDDDVMTAHDIARIDYVIANLYPFAETVAQADCTVARAIENIDIGGPAMIRSAAKNHADVLAVVDPGDYEAVIAALDGGSVSEAMRQRFAVKAFRHTARYDAMVAEYLGPRLAAEESLLPETLTLTFERSEVLRYGENPHQRAAFYVEPHPPSGTVASAKQLQGKALSFNNIADTDAAMACVAEFEAPACVIVKHANPCGVAIGSNLLEAYEHAFATDTNSAFGGVIAFNRPLDEVTLETILARQFVEVVVAPAVSEAAVNVAARKKNVRVLATGGDPPRARGRELKRVGGGLLVQEADELALDQERLRVASDRAPTTQELADLHFAWRVAWYVKSNAIVYAANGRTLGIGAGQMKRVDSAELGVKKAADEALPIAGSVMASDVFFPFRDSIDAAAAAGVTAVVQPGGSIRDDEVVAAANEHNIAMLLTDVRHFRH